MKWTSQNSYCRTVPQPGHVLEIGRAPDGNWWWQVRAGDKRASSAEKSNPGKTKQVAKQRAEYWYRKLLKQAGGSL